MKVIKIENTPSGRELAEVYDEVFFRFATSAFAEKEYDEIMRTDYPLPEGYDISGLDAKMSAMFKKHYRQQKTLPVKRVLKHTLRIAAVLLLTLALISAVMYATVEDFKTAVLNFFITKEEHFTSFILDEVIQPDTVKDSRPSRFKHYPAWIPEGYQKTDDVANSSGRTIVFENSVGSWITFLQFSKRGNMMIDSENAELEIVEINGFKMHMYVKEGNNSIIWTDGRIGLTVVSDNFGVLKKFVENIKK